MKGPTIENVLTGSTPFYDIWSSRHDFNFLATSYESGFEKPSSSIFQHAYELAAMNYASRLERIQRPLSIGEALKMVSHIPSFLSTSWIHVGADYSKDYLGGKDYEFEAFHLVREGEGWNPVEGAQTISNLIELTKIINLMVQEKFQGSESARS